MNVSKVVSNRNIEFDKNALLLLFDKIAILYIYGIQRHGGYFQSLKIG